MNKSDFYFFSYNEQDYIFHIRSSKIINIKRGSSLNAFFRQLILKEDLLSNEEFDEFANFIEKEFKFSKNSNSQEQIEHEINMQSIILPISGKCNLRCSYCFAQNNGNFGFGDIDSQKAKEIIDYVMNNNDREYPCSINFFGGEPLLNIKTIKETIEYIKIKYSDRKVNYGITTNGTILTKEILTLLKQNKIGVLLSYDGPIELGPHRTYINGKHSHHRVLKNVKILKSENINFHLRATIPSDCISLRDTYAYFENLNIPFAAVLAYKSRNIDSSCIYDERITFFESEYKILLDYYTSRIDNNLPINCYSINSDLKVINDHNSRFYSCGGGIGLFAIVDNGNIFSCEHLAFDEKYKIGNIANGVNKETLKLMQPEFIDKIEGCKECWIKYLCVGGCFSEKILTGRYNKTLSQDECLLKKMYWHFIINLYIKIKQKKDISNE